MEYISHLRKLSIFNFFSSLASRIQSSFARLLGILHLSRSSTKNILNYTINGRRYCVVFPNKRGPKKWISVVNQDDVDVSKEIDAASGICYNFHHIPTTPNMLGYERLTFTMMLGETYTFEKNDVIEFE